MKQAATHIQCNIIMPIEFENNGLSCSLGWENKDFCCDFLNRICFYMQPDI